jgi:hypothetical protein
MTDKDFFLEKIKINAPHVYEFAKKYYDQIRIEAAGREIDRSKFCLRVQDGFIITKEMLTELNSMEDFEYVFVSRYETHFQFKTNIPFKK